MFVFVIAAIVQLLVGFFIYEMYDPQKRNRMIFSKKVISPSTVSNSEKNVNVVRAANKIVLRFCFLMTFLTLLNGILNKYLNLMDLKEVLLIITVVTVFPLRYLYILKRS